MKKTLCSIIAVCAIAGICGPAVIGRDLNVRPAYQGVSPACPTTDSIPKFEIQPPILTGEKTFEISVEIDKTGQVKRCRSKELSDSLIAKYAFSSLKNLKFQPALVDNMPVSSELPVRITVNPRFRSTNFTFPVGVNLEIADRNFYFAAIEKLGVAPPKLKKFPAYFCELKAKDSLKILPFLLLKIKLDDKGKLLDLIEIRNTIGEFSAQVQSAVLWAEFEPLKISQKPARSESFLLISFLPQVAYPTKKIEYHADSTMDWHVYWRVQLIPDTVGLMTPPLPRELVSDQQGLTGKEKIMQGEVVAGIAIDSTGKVSVKQTDAQESSYHQAILGITRSTLLFPAMDYAGTPKRFTGAARYTFQGSGTVRIDYLWLNYH